MKPTGISALVCGVFAGLLAGCGSVPFSAVAETPEPTVVPDVSRPASDEIVYFVIPDRFENGDPTNDKGGIEGDWQDHGYRPEHRAFYLGGDLKGLTSRLDYIKGLGATAIWLGPIYQNKAVQGPPGLQTSGYHGYWITDFMRVDAHLGEDADMRAFVDGAHARGLKVYLDIITNHTADVILYRECDDPDQQTWTETYECAYRSKADFPWTTQGGPDGEAINDGFMGDAEPFQTEENFERLNTPNYAYTPFIPEGEEDVKNPAWLNDLRYYHNRGHTTFEGESSTYGDFAGLDDLMTEDPRVVDGFIDIYKDWITRYRIDGFRIDTAKHVNPEFWRQFNSAMVDHAASLDIDHFYVFGEAYDPDPGALARFTRVDGFPTVLDFALQRVLQDVLVGGEPAARFVPLFRADDLWEGGAASARLAPTFTGNHDMGRFAGFLRAAHPEMPESELFDRVRLAHAAILFARGVPVIYYGDEQGFVSDGNDQKARETMFPGLVEEYNDNDLIGTDATTAESNFDADHPMYRAIAEMAELRTTHAALRRGDQLVRLAELDGGVFAFSRIDPEGDGEILVVMNLRNEPRRVNIEVDARSKAFEALMGACAKAVSVTGSYAVEIAPLDVAVCRSAPWSDVQ
ncbi:MAG: alpha-amylase family glycosyl hydrolase [Pseudomonadota bacterium]